MSNVELVRQLLALLAEDKSTATANSVATPELAVLVTTKHRGVFFGYTSDIDGDSITLRKARMCVYWSPAMRGVLGLAAVGPDDNCRVSPAIDLKLNDITSVAKCTPAAVERWETFPWKS